MATALEPTLTSVLIATADQLANPAAWSRRAGARDALGNRVDPCSPAAVSWCLWGALESQLGRIAYEPDRYALTLAIEGHLLAIARYTLGPARAGQFEPVLGRSLDHTSGHPGAARRGCQQPHASSARQCDALNAIDERSPRLMQHRPTQR